MTVSLCVEVIEHPRTMVALEGTNVNFTCMVRLVNNGDHKDLVLNNVISTNAITGMGMRDEYAARGITWMYMQDGLTVGYQVTILANTQNNGTSLHCDGADCSSNIGMLYVVQGKYYI